MISCYDLAGSVGSIDSEIEAEEQIDFYCFYCSENSIVDNLEPLDQFKWGFQQSIPFQMSTIIMFDQRRITGHPINHCASCVAHALCGKGHMHIAHISMANFRILTVIHTGFFTMKTSGSYS